MFTHLIAPVSNDRFWTDVWSQTHLYIARQDPTYFATVLPIEVLDQLLKNQYVSASYFDVYKNGKYIDRNSWSETQSTHTIVPERLLYQFANGATLIFSNANTILPSVGAYCSKLTRELGYDTHANIYITPPHSQGFDVHYDSHDVFILQVHGTKVWHLYNRAADAPTDEQPYDSKIIADPGLPATILTLQPGDTLYVPRGYLHDAAATDTASIHITLGINPPYWYQLLKDPVLQEAAFRQAIPNPLMPPEQQAALTAAFQAALASWPAKLDPANLLDHQHKNVGHQKKYTTTGRFRDLLNLPHITLDTVVQRRPDLLYTLTATATELQLKFGARQITYPPFLASTLDPLEQPDPFPIHALKGLIADQGKLELVTNLIRKGFLEIVTVAPAASETA